MNHEYLQTPATAGMRPSHPAVTAKWVLEQFGSRKGAAKKRYADFIEDGMEGHEIWSDIQNQIILGKDDFVSRFSEYAKWSEDMKEIPKSQRYINRPSLKDLFKGNVKDKAKRDCKIREAVENHGYSQNEVADFTGMHYSTISRLVSRS